MRHPRRPSRIHLTSHHPHHGTTMQPLSTSSPRQRTPSHEWRTHRLTLLRTPTV